MCISIHTNRKVNDMKNKLGTIYENVTTIKNGNIQLPEEILQELNLNAGDKIHLETTPHNELILCKLDTKYITIPLPSDYYKEIEETIQNKKLNVTVDELIKKALLDLDFNQLKKEHDN